MNLGKTVFSQLMSLLPDYEFNKCVTRYNGDYRIKEFTCKEHFLVMSFSQLTYRDSLRDIESCLQAMSKKLYHSGIKNPVARNTLAKANERRNWRIYADFAQVLIAETRKLYAHENTFLNSTPRKSWVFDVNFGGSSNCWWGSTLRFMTKDFKLKTLYGRVYFQAEDGIRVHSR